MLLGRPSAVLVLTGKRRHAFLKLFCIPCFGRKWALCSGADRAIARLFSRGECVRMAAAAVAEGARALDESSDSDAEHEPGAPQKLIRKVSTSGQIRSKVRSRRSCAGMSRRWEMRLR